MEGFLHEGRTKAIERVAELDKGGNAQVRIWSRDATTLHKSLAARTASNTFVLLQKCGIHSAFVRQDSPATYLALELTMIRLKVVVHGCARERYLVRHPGTASGAAFAEPQIEFFLDAQGRQWPGLEGTPHHELPCDGPFLDIQEHGVYLHLPDRPCVQGAHFLRLSLAEAFPLRETKHLLPAIAERSRLVYRILAHAWRRAAELEGIDLAMPELTLEYGFAVHTGELLLAGTSLEAHRLKGLAADLTDRFAELVDETRELVHLHTRPISRSVATA